MRKASIGLVEGQQWNQLHSTKRRNACQQKDYREDWDVFCVAHVASLIAFQQHPKMRRVRNTQGLSFSRFYNSICDVLASSPPYSRRDLRGSFRDGTRATAPHQRKAAHPRKTFPAYITRFVPLRAEWRDLFVSQAAWQKHVDESSDYRSEPG